MIAWLVAAALLVAVLGFEALMFRYVRGKSASVGGSDGGPAESADARDGEETAPGDGEGTAPGDAPVTQCPQCGAHNDGAAPARYCWRCLGRLSG